MRTTVLAAVLLAGIGFAWGVIVAKSDSFAAQPVNISDYIDQARATPTPTPTPAVGDPIKGGLLWVYVRVPEDKAGEMNEDGCQVRDDALDQAIWDGDPFVIADEKGSILQQDEFKGSTRIRAEQTPWRPGTNDEGWTADDGTRWCRLQGILDRLPYSPVYQIAFGKKARGPYAVSWDSVVKSENRMILGVDLTAASEQEAVRTPVAVITPEVSFDTVATTTDPIALDGAPVTVSVDYLAGLGHFTAVAVTDDGRRIPLFKENEDFSGFVRVPGLEGAHSVSFEVTAAGLWTLVVW